jgi:hypothetical protein
LLEKEDAGTARAVALVLLQRPEGLDADFLCTNFDHARPRARRVYCALLSRVPQSAQTRGALLRALSDSAAAVRQEAANALGASSNSTPQVTAALEERLSDENEYAAAAAASALARLNATDAAPAILTNLEGRLKKPEASPEELQNQSAEVRDFPLGPAFQTQPNMPPQFNLQPMARAGGGLPMRREPSPASAALIEALGKLHYQPAREAIFGMLDGPHAFPAAKALKALAPEELARRLAGEACDKKADPQSRDRALMLLAAPPASGPAAQLVPLLDDTTPVPSARPMPGREWRICDRAAETIAALLGRPMRIMPTQPIDQRDMQIEEIRQSIKAAY